MQDIHRNMMQIYNSWEKMAGKDKDTIDELIALSKTLDSGALFVSVVPNLVFVLCHKWQSDLIRLVTIEREVQEVIGIDVTNNCTGFSVTPLVKAHPLRQNENGKTPCILGPLFISNTKKTEAFTSFATALLIKVITENSNMIIE